MKKILFVSYALPPYLYPQSIQIGRFLKYLKKEYDVHILCAEETNTLPDPTLYPDIFSGIDQEKILRVPYVFRPYLNYALNRICPVLLKRPDHYANWALTAVKACKAHFSDTEFDAILTFSYPFSLNILGQKLKRHYGCKWLAHQSDPWVDNPSLHLGPVTRRINNWMEKKYYADADSLIFTCVECSDFMKQKHPTLADRVTFVDHSFDPSLYPKPTKREDSPKIIRYIGNFYGKRTVKPLLRALPLLSEEARKNLHFEVVGANIKTKMIIKRANLPQGLLSVTGSVNYQESLRLMVESDAVMMIDAPYKKHNILFPCKLADYIGANRPILGICSVGPTQRILDSLGYASYRHEQTEDIAQALEKISLGEYGHKDGLTEEKRRPYLETENSRKFIEIVNSFL